MKKYLLGVAGAMVALATLGGCSYDDDPVWQRFDELEEQIEQNSTDIETLTALLDALNNGKSIVAIEEDDASVTLIFDDGSTVTINHGKDGADGKDGKDGEDGKDGKDGVNGADGKDGKDGVNGADGDSLFASIEESDTEVIITLTDGRIIRLQKATDSQEEELDYTLRVLTFEDDTTCFTPYSLDYAGVEITTWSDLIDDMQYGGALLYNNYGEDIYYWYDEGNTELFHQFTTPYWGGGHAISNYVIEDYETIPDGYYGWYELQLANPIGGNNLSSNFAVHNGYSDFFNSQIYDSSLQTLEFADGVERVIDHMWVTNTCYLLNSLTYGDGFNVPATENTYVKVIAYGYNTADEETGSVEFMLCENGECITEWQKWDLSPLGKVAKVAFNFAASEDQSGSYGLNCPAYFAYDDIAVRFEK